MEGEIMENHQLHQIIGCIFLAASFLTRVVSDRFALIMLGALWVLSSILLMLYNMHLNSLMRKQVMLDNLMVKQQMELGREYWDKKTKEDKARGRK